MAKKPVDLRQTQRWLPAFKYFLTLITVDSKEMVEPGPITPYRAQIMALDEIADGIDRGIHWFVCLKARQLGLSTVLIALDIFWLYMHPGLQGAFICDTEANREAFRLTITRMMESLPKGFRIPVKKHDRMGLLLANGSRLQYLSAGKGKNSGLGRSRALNFVHATELSSWGDPKGYETLADTLALENPNRLYLFESTALGYNLFYDCWKDAEEDEIGKRAFFIGWWAKDIYLFAEDSLEYEKWWGNFPEYTQYEAETTLAVHERYGWEITPEQWAWYRWKADGRSEQAMMEEFPSLASEAFTVTGSPFFNGRRVTADIAAVASGAVAFNAYIYEFGEDFLKMRLNRTMDADEAQLRVWETPKPDAKYVIGIDVAFGSSEEADRTVLSVWRCFADKLVQVAEYVSSITSTQNAAWVLAHLAGEYRDCLMNLELQGGGSEVMNEIRYLRQSMSFGPMQNAAREMKLEHTLDSARWFLWRKVDNIHGVPSAYNFKTTQDTKISALNRYNDAYNTGQVIVRSMGLLDEMMTLRRDGDKVGASGRNKDDRVIAGMLANFAWKEWVQSGLMAANRTYDREMREQLDRDEKGTSVLSQIIPSFMAEQLDRRSAADLKRLLEGPLEPSVINTTRDFT